MPVVDTPGVLLDIERPSHVQDTVAAPPVGSGGAPSSSVRPAERRPDRRRWLIGSLLLIIGAIPLQRLRGSFPTENYFHSDIAFLPALFGDVASGGSISSWGLPEAPYFIPDWPLYFVAWLLTPSYSSGQALFAFLQIGLLAIVWIALMRYLSSEPLLSTALGLAALVTAGLAGQVPADYASVSFAHFGTFILTIAGLVLYFRLHFGAAHRGRLLLAVFVLTCLATASDRLFIAWWVAPVLGIQALAIAEHRFRRRPGLAQPTNSVLPKASGALVSSVVAATVGGLLIRAAIVRTSGNYRVEVDSGLSIRARLGLIVRIFTDSELIQFWPLYSAAVLASALVWLWLIRRRRNDTPFLVFGLWFTLASITTLSAEFLTAGPGWRFHQFMYHVPILMVGAWLPGLFRRISVPPRNVAVAGSVVLMTAGALPGPGDDLSFTHTPGEVTCLDEILAGSGSRVGIGNYAASRLAVVHSGLDLDVGTRNSWMAPEEDVHSRAWARDTADFAILYPTIFGAMPENTIRSLSEQRPVEATCGRWRVLDFGPGGIDLDRLASPGRRAEIPGCWYTNSIGTSVPSPEVTTDACGLRVTSPEADPGTGTYIGFGSYYDVGPGSFLLSAQLSAGQTAVGTFEVAVWDANTGALQAVHSAPLTDPRITIDVPESGPELSLEGRILYQGGATLVLDSMRIERVN